MKRVLQVIIILCILPCVHGFAQQNPLYDQYIFNPYLINPAYAGCKDHTPVRLSARQQWKDFEGAPSTYQFSFHKRIIEGNKHRGVFNKKAHAFGGQLYSSVKGPYALTGFGLTYAYHIPFEKNILSMGTTFSYQQYRIKVNKLTTTLAQDPALTNDLSPIPIYDADFSVMLYKPQKYSFSASLLQMARSIVKFDEDIKTSDSRMDKILALHGGLRLFENDFLSFEPSILILAKPLNNFEKEIHFNGKVVMSNAIKKYNNEEIEMVFSYRTTKAFVVGVHFKMDKFVLGYAYEYDYNKIYSYSAGTHQVVIGYNFEKMGR